MFLVTLYIRCISVVVVWHYVRHVANHLAYLHGLSQVSVVVFLFCYRFLMVCDNLFLYYTTFAVCYFSLWYVLVYIFVCSG